MAAVNSFPPLSRVDARILILGSMPGVRSLAEQQYYAHPRNSFWPIMSTLFGPIDLSDYRQKKSLLINHQIALWDVLEQCYRPGSLDAAIDPNSLACNDFNSFFKRHPGLTHIYFNGASADKFFTRHVTPTLDVGNRLVYQRLPSTSPAHAAMTLTEKTEHWRAIILAQNR